MTRTSRIAALLSVAAIVGHGTASAGCTLVSGWSDLQDGRGPGNPDGSAVPMGVLCGASRCAVAVGCCEGVIGASACEASSQTCSVPSVYLTCSDSSQCTVSLGHTAQCCDANESEGVTAASCRTSCAAGTNVVCDPTLASPTCPSGKTCQPAGDSYGYDTCQ